MKRLLIILLPFMLLRGIAQAQFLFGQQGKLRSVMAEQIAQLNIYHSALKSGYNISQHGLDLAHLYKDSTYTRHSNYFASLKQITPAVQQSDKAKAIPQMSAQISKLFATEIAFQKAQKQLSSKEQSYLQSVSDHIQQLCGTDLKELEQITTPGTLQLTDQERLERIDKLYAAMKDKLAFAGSFTAKSHQLAVSRKAAKADKNSIRNLYGLPNH